MELYHVLNRGVDKRDIFLDDQDRFRFIHDLFEFNDKMNAFNMGRTFNEVMIDVRRQSSQSTTRDPLVDIHAFSMMPNHYHLLLSSRVENGISLFMKKLNGGFAKYFNEKYDRNGALFQGRYKKIEVNSEAHFLYLPYYIHLNPLDMVAPEWRDGKLHDHAKAVTFLESYRWSSHLDYLSKHNFPSITNREFLTDVFGESKGYKNGIRDFLRQLSSGGLGGIMLE